MSKLNPLLWPRPPVIWNYGLAGLWVGMALVISRWPALHLGDAPVSLFLSAVLLTAWFGGAGPGLLAATLSAISFDYYFLLPAHSLLIKADEIPRLAVFTASALFVGALGAAQRSATESLRRARDDLKGTVQDLEKTNKALRGESRDRKRAEDQLRRSEGYLAEAQRLSQTGSWAATVGEIRFLSEECYRLLGFDPRHGQPLYETFFQRIYPDDQTKFREAVETAGRESTDFELEYRFVHPRGEIRDIHVVGHPTLGPPGDPVEFVGTLMDVTERKRADEERDRLRQAQADLAHINRVTTMGELTASLAHEVNQPIAAAVTSANSCIRWLDAEVPNLDKARAAATRIVNDGTRAAEIISRIRLLFQKRTRQWQLVDINEIIGEMIVLLRGEATRCSISVSTELAGDLPQVVGDRVQLQQVMMNLMTNSIDALKAVDGARELAITSGRTQNDQLLVSFSDTGVGLPAQQEDRIFDAFFTTKPDGTGMGLRICRSIVESHGGRLWATDNVPRGAKFFLNLPVQTGSA